MQQTDAQEKHQEGQERERIHPVERNRRSWKWGDWNSPQWMAGVWKKQRAGVRIVRKEMWARRRGSSGWGGGGPGSRNSWNRNGKAKQLRRPEDNKQFSFAGRDGGRTLRSKWKSFGEGLQCQFELALKNKAASGEGVEKRQPSHTADGNAN